MPLTCNASDAGASVTGIAVTAMIVATAVGWMATTQPANANGETITSHGISVFGDLKYGSDFEHFDYVNPDAPQGGTMRFVGTLASSTFDSINPFIIKGESAQGTGRMHDTLLVGSADETDSAYGLLADTIEYPESRQWVIFNMNPSATFSDGEPIEASDVLFSYNILIEKGRPVYQIAYQDIETVEALGPHKVKFTFKDGVSTRELIQTAGSIPVLPEHYYETVEFADSTLVPPVVSGQFLPTDIKPGRSISYCKRPDYWAKDHRVHVGSSNFDCFLYEYFADRVASFEAFKSGAYLLHEEFFSKNWATLYDFPALEKGWVIKTEIEDQNPSGAQGYWFNLRRNKFQDIRVRQAIGMMFNFEWSNQALFYGIYKRTDSFWENSDMQAEGMPTEGELQILADFRDQLPETVFSEPAFVPPVNSPDRTDRRALRTAARLLEEAGWTMQDGIRKNTAGKPLIVTILDSSPAFERINNPFIENLKRLGIDARFELVDHAQYQQRTKDLDYDIIPGRFRLPQTPGSELRQLFSSASANQPDTSNISGLADPAVDGIIESVLAAETREEVKTRVKALDRVLRDRHIWVPQWYSGTHKVAYWDVFGMPETKAPYVRGDGQWWLDQDKYDALKAAGAPLP
ncbi:MAG: extracellular solute-binding protein [Pseudomonadota bacterium]